MANIKRLKTENINFRCVYCAFGSMHGAWNKRIRKFLYRLFDAVSGIDNLILVCAFTDHEGLLDTTKIPENVLMFDRVPQLRMLQLADLFITHGGLGSIKESIMAGVPMLAYPITNNWDSNGNCTKIAFHEFGLKGNIDRDSALHIIAKIYRIFNTTSFRKSLLSINDLVVRVYTDKRFVEHIDKLLAD